MARNWNTYNASYRRKLRAALFEKQRGLCYYCGCRMTLDKAKSRRPNYATFEHVVPLSQGGSDGDNLVLACWLCNKRKGDLSAETYTGCLNSEGA